jgi:dTDP-4-dehydrorhamnose reductase
VVEAQKILVTGSRGMLATDLVKASVAAGYEAVGLSHEELDITQPKTVRDALEQIKPDLVINTPGIGVDACQVNPSDGYLIHTWAPGILAANCQRVGAAFMYVSTCGLFGDDVKHYNEYDPVFLKTEYAKSKHQGELEATRRCLRTYVIRPGWLFGGGPGQPRNFVYQRYQEAKEHPVVRSAGDKFGCPTHTGELAAKMLELAGTEEFGLYHVTNSGTASRYDYVKCIVEAFGLDTVVESVDSSAYPRSAPVPDCEMLENLNLKFLGLAPMDQWQEAIERYVHGLKMELG